MSSAKQPGSFMFRLGTYFLTHYYKILIDTGSSVILCAEDDASSEMLGFASGSLDGGSRMRALRANRIRLALAALPKILRHPWLLRELLSRQNATAQDSDGMGYIVESGAHEDFWAYLPNRGSGAIDLHLKWLAMMRLLGATTIAGEVDKVNASILRVHLMLGAKVVKAFRTPDGRERLIINYLLPGDKPSAS